MVSPPSRKTILVLWAANLSMFVLGWWLTTEWKPPRGEYPTKPINLVVPFGAGGGSDVYARIFKAAIDDNQLLPAPLVIHNRGGAGATIGSRYVRDATPDGYTMLFLHDAIITAKYSGMVRYGPEAFEPVACTGELGMVIAVAEDSPYQTLTELLEAARERPNELSFAVNLGALTHVAGLQLEQALPGAKFQFPQSGGGNDRYNDLIGQHVDASGFSLEEFLRYRSGADDQSPQLRGLAYLDVNRTPAAPEVPTASEQGFEIININRFYWWVPKGTPADRIEVLASTLKAALETDYVKRQMENMSCKRVFRTGQELADQLAQTERQIAQVEFAKPQGVPNVQKLSMIGGVFLILIWAIQLKSKALIAMAAVGLLASFTIAQFVTALDGLGLFLAISGIGVSVWHLGPLLQNPKAAVCASLTVAYVVMLANDWGDFRLLTALFLLLFGGTLTGWNLQQLPILALIAQLMAFGVFAAFQLVFDIPLPG